MKPEYLTPDNQYRLFLNNSYDDTIATKAREHKNDKYVNIDSYMNNTLTTKLQRFKYVSHLKTKSSHCHILYDGKVHEMSVENASLDIKLTPLSDKKQVILITEEMGMTINNKDIFKGHLEPIITNSIKSISSLVHHDVNSDRDYLLIFILDGNNGIHLFCFDVNGDFAYWESSFEGVNDDCISVSLCYEQDYEESNLLMNTFIQNTDDKQYRVNSLRFDVSDVHITATNKHTPKITVYEDNLIGDDVLQTVEELQLILHSSYFSPSENRLVHRVVDKMKNQQFK